MVPASNKYIDNLKDKFSNVRIYRPGFANYVYELTDFIAANTPDYGPVALTARYYRNLIRTFLSDRPELDQEILKCSLSLIFSLLFEPDVALFFILNLGLGEFTREFIEACLPVSKSVMILADIMANVTYYYKEVDGAIIKSFEGFEITDDLNHTVAAKLAEILNGNSEKSKFFSFDFYLPSNLVSANFNHVKDELLPYDIPERDLNISQYCTTIISSNSAGNMETMYFNPNLPGIKQGFEENSKYPDSIIMAANFLANTIKCYNDFYDKINDYLATKSYISTLDNLDDDTEIAKLRNAYALMITQQIIIRDGSEKFYVAIDYRSIKKILPEYPGINFWVYVSLDEALIIDNYNRIVKVLYQEEKIDEKVRTKQLRKKENIEY